MNKKVLIILIAIVSIGVLTYTFWTNMKVDKNIIIKKIKYIDIDAKEAYKLITDDKAVVIIDVSPRFEKGYIPNSLNFYVGDGSLDKALPSLNKDKTYLVYCHVDSASIPGAQKLIDAGFTKVYRLKGNYPLWLEEGYPIEISLKSVNNYVGSGLGSRSFLNGEFKHIVTADIKDPAQGKFYEGWLVAGDKFFSTGAMKKENGKYVLTYTSMEDSRAFKSVVITEETSSNGLDNKPETHVLEGEFE